MHKPTVASLEFEQKSEHKIWRQRFLERIDCLEPWSALEATVEPRYCYPLEEHECCDYPWEIGPCNRGLAKHDLHAFRPSSRPNTDTGRPQRLWWLATCATNPTHADTIATLDIRDVTLYVIVATIVAAMGVMIGRKLYIGREAAADRDDANAQPSVNRADKRHSRWPTGTKPSGVRLSILFAGRSVPAP